MPTNWGTYLAACVLVMLLLPGCTSIRTSVPLRVSPEDWAMFARAEGRTGATEERLTPPLSLLWEQDVSGGIGSGSPLIVDTFVVVANMRGEIHVIHGRTGKRVGWVGLGDAIQGSPAVDGTVAFIGVSNSRQSLLAYDLMDGRTRWGRELGDIEASPLLFQQRIFIGNTAGVFHCVDRHAGEILWTFTLPDNSKHKGIRAAAAAEGTAVVFAAEDGGVYALDPTTGKLLWRFQADAPIVASPAILRGIVYVGDLGGGFHALHLDSGNRVWHRNTGAPIYAGPAVHEEMVILGATDGILYAWQRTDGTERWRRDLGGVINAGAAVSGNVAYVGTLKKRLFGISLADGSIAWTYETQGRIKTPPAVARGKLVVATDDRSVLAFGEGGP